MKLPIFRVNDLYHLGSMDSEQRSGRSYEGHCLSASLCPNAWQSIARIGGDCHKLSKPDATFLNIPEMLNNSSLEKRLLKFGKDQGFIQLSEVYELSWEDCETEDLITTRVRTHDEALEEMFCNEDMEMKKMMDWIETSKLLEATKQTRTLSAANPRDLLAVAYADHLAEKGYPIDGIFMDHKHDPLSLSAHAFGILPSKISEFTCEQTPIPDDVENVRVCGADAILDISKLSAPKPSNHKDLSVSLTI